MDRNISIITMDDCLSNNDMIDIFLEKLSLSGSLLLNGKVIHMQCVTHVLNLIMNEG